MAVCQKSLPFFPCFLVFTVAFFLFPRVVLAQVVISEFSSMTTSDWVEVYNSSEEVVDLSEFRLSDADGNSKQISDCLLASEGFFAESFSHYLNKGGDRVVLKRGDSVFDCVAYNDGPACEGEDINLPELFDGEYGVRKPDGLGGWVKLPTETKSDNSFCAEPSPTPTLTLPPSPLPSSTPAPTLSPTTAIYRINEVKDEEGEALSSVEVYVDGDYTHHYTPEELTFGEEKYCDDDKQVACGFGEHTIRLEKSGYESWAEVKTMEAGLDYTVDPVMAKTESTSSPTATSTPSPTVTPKPTVTKKPTPKPTKTPTPTEIEEESESTEAGFFSLEEENPGEEEGEVLGKSDEEKRDLLPFFFIGGGLILVVVALAIFKKDFLKELIRRRRRKII